MKRTLIEIAKQDLITAKQRAEMAIREILPFDENVLANESVTFPYEDGQPFVIGYTQPNQGARVIALRHHPFEGLQMQVVGGDRWYPLWVDDMLFLLEELERVL